MSTPITHVRPRGIETADGALREHDVIIYATGADVAWEGVGVNRAVRGEGGRELRAYWEALGGPQAYAGLAVPHVSRRLRGADASFQTTLWSSGRTRRPGLGGGRWACSRARLRASSRP